MKKGKLVWLPVLVLLILLAGGEQTIPADAGASIPLETGGYLAITFDDGPQYRTTSRLLDGLRERGANATFFLVGERIAGNEDLVRRMHTEGHQVGNHSWSHKLLQGASEAVLRQEIKRTEHVLQAVLGDGEYWLRPPYGLLNEEQRALVKTPMAHWSVDPKDWDTDDHQAIVESVISVVKPGDIILLHDIYDASVDAALEIIDRLTAQGYWFVTVEELLALSGIQPEDGVTYLSA